MIVGNALGNPLSNGVGFMSPVNSTGYTVLERTIILQAESDTGYTGSARLDLIGTASGTASATGSSLASTISAVAPNSASGTLSLSYNSPYWRSAISAFPSSPVFSCSATGAEFENYISRGTSGENKFIAAGALFSMDRERKAPTIINVHNTTGGNVVYWVLGNPELNEMPLPMYNSSYVYRMDATSRSSSDWIHFYSYYYTEPYVGRLTLHSSWFGSSLSGLKGAGAQGYGISYEPEAYREFWYTIDASKFDHIDAFLNFRMLSVIKGSAVVKLHNAKKTSTVYFESALSSGDRWSNQMIRFSLPTSDVKAVYELRVDVGYGGQVNMEYPVWGFTGVTK